jgi:carbamoyltransferase
LSHRASTVLPARRLVLGLNKYSHDASVCVVDADTGCVIFAAEKERITRKKHDAGDVGELVAWALDSIDCDLSDVELVVSATGEPQPPP